jgi:hypothetical protein
MESQGELPRRVTDVGATMWLTKPVDLAGLDRALRTAHGMLKAAS